MIKGIYRGPSDDLTYIDGNEYEILRLHTDIGYYGVIDEVGDACFCETDAITLIDATDEDLDWVIYDQSAQKDVLVHKGRKSI